MSLKDQLAADEEANEQTYQLQQEQQAVAVEEMRQQQALIPPDKRIV